MGWLKWASARQRYGDLAWGGGRSLHYGCMSQPSGAVCVVRLDVWALLQRDIIAELCSGCRHTSRLQVLRSTLPCLFW